MDARNQLARATAQLISQDFLADHSLEDLASRLGITDRQMRRVFQEEFGVSPVEFWQTQRLLLAKQLLTDSRMPVTAVAMASGFQSLRRFNTLLKQRYRLTPTELRKSHGTDMPRQLSDLHFHLSYRPPLAWDHALAFLAGRCIPGVEAVENGAYLRTVQFRRQKQIYTGTVRVEHDAQHQRLSVNVSDGLLPVCAVILERVKRLFDLHADPVAIDQALGALATSRAGLRVPGSFDGFEMAVRAVLGQQISVAGARTLAGRLVNRFGMPVETPYPSLTHLFPPAQRLASASRDDIASLGIVGSRAQTLIALARAVDSGELFLEPGSLVDEALDALRRIPGIGEWTAQYIAMLALSWPDAFPHTDLGIRKALNENNPKKILELAEKWRPWRAYAALHLWHSLEKKS